MSKRKKKNKKNKSLSGVAISSSQKERVIASLKEGGIILLAAVAAGGAGAAVGKHSLAIGLPLTILGIYKNNKYITAAGLGLVLSNGFQRKGTAPTTQGVEGFDIKQIATDAKDRVGTFFQNFSEKLYLPKQAGSTNGLEGEDQVTYFVNPYSNKELDLSSIDRLQEQIAQMNTPVTGYEEDQSQDTQTEGMEFDREF